MTPVLVFFTKAIKIGIRNPVCYHSPEEGGLLMLFTEKENRINIYIIFIE